MPELPEVEVCRRGLAPELVGAVVGGVVIRAPKLRHEIPPELIELLPGCRIIDVRRRGKYLLVDCERAGVQGSLIIHLGMSGNLRFVPPDLPPAKHDHFDLVLAAQTLRLADPRELGCAGEKAADTGIAKVIRHIAASMPHLSDAIAVNYFAHSSISRAGGEATLPKEGGP